MENVTVGNMFAVGGVVGLFVVLLNIAAAFGWIKGESKEKLAAIIQTVVTGVLAIAGALWPAFMDQIPVINHAADLLADLGGYVILAIPIVVEFSGIVHRWLTKIPWVNRWLGFQLSP